jgi:hypothetical protein
VLADGRVFKEKDTATIGQLFPEIQDAKKAEEAPQSLVQTAMRLRSLLARPLRVD